jgi:hypothetical protein
MEFDFLALIILQQYQNQRLRSQQDIASNPSYPSKLFELDLSPIIEDVYAFSDKLPALFREGTQTDAGSVDTPLDSSTTSYGELLSDKVSLNPFYSVDYTLAVSMIFRLRHSNPADQSAKVCRFLRPIRL